MSGQNWCIIPVFLIILQQTSTNFGKTLLPAHACLLPYPRWPQDFRWSSNGPLSNHHCVWISETADPSWNENYFCSSDSKTDPHMRWSSRNPIPGMKCTRITEPADRRFSWHNNYLCLPINSTLNFQWSYQGPIANKLCIQWKETPGRSSWNDNYLCGEDENPALRERNQTGCGQQEDFFYGQNVKQSIAKSNKTKLSGFCLNCTTNTTFKVQYTNDTLCSCDRIVNLGQPVFFECNKKLRLNFSVTISVRNISRQWGENCTFIFSFTGHGVTKTVPVTLTISTPYIINTDFRSSTLSLVDQPSSTSSFMVANSTYTTWKMSSTVVKPQPSQSVVPVHTEIVITPSVEESLTSEPLLMTSSPTKSVFLVTSIKAAIASKLLPSSTWSPDTEKLKKLKNDIEFINNVNTSAVKISDRKTIDRVLDAAANLINTNLTTEYQKEDPGMLAVEVLQDLGHSISRQLDLGNNKSVTFEKVTEDLVLSAAVINTTISPGFTFPTDDIKMTSGEKIDIPRSVFASEKSYFVGIIFEAYGEMRNNTGDLILGTKVINAVVSPRPSDELKEPVNMTFEKNIWVDLTLAGECSFWIENNTLSGEHGRWSTRQCFKTFENESHINCSCHHFTNFAVLLKVSDEEQSSVVVNPQPSQSVPPVHTGIVITPSIKESLTSQPLLMTSSPTKSILLVTSIKASIASKFLPTSTWSPDIGKIKKLRNDINFINNVNTSAVKISDTNTIDRVLDAAANLINTNLTTEDQKEDPGMQAVKVLQNLGDSISRQLDLGNAKSVTFEKVTEDLVFGAAVINTTISPGFIFPSDDIKMTSGEKIDIPRSVFVSDKSYFVGIIFNAYREMRNNTGDLNLGTKVINAAVSPRPSDELKDPVEMTFKKNIRVDLTLARECSFWIENNTLSGEHGRWSTRQCFELTFENETHIKCGCRHFTNFAVLFKVSDEEQHLQEEHSFQLAIITYIGLGLSILGCLLTFIIYIALPNIRSERATIHQNLVFALGIADVIFLVTVAVKPNGDSCTAVAMLAFFFYLAVFFWMLVEGVYIYLMVTKVFHGNIRRRRRVAYIVGWGCPVIISLVTWTILRHDVVSEYHCWLSVQTGAIWAFVGPGLAIILTNCIILVVVMRITWVTFADDQEYSGLKSATKTFGVVIPILGITWIFGIMAFNDSSIVFQYIFAIVNSIQGALIFILYCIVNKEVRNEINRRITIWQTRREMSSSSGTGGKRAMYTYEISSGKNKTYNRTTSAQGTPDLYRYPLSEIEEVPLSEKVEKGRSFENSGAAFESDSEIGVNENKVSDQETDGDKEIVETVLGS